MQIFFHVHVTFGTIFINYHLCSENNSSVRNVCRCTPAPAPTAHAPTAYITIWAADGAVRDSARVQPVMDPRAVVVRAGRGKDPQNARLRFCRACVSRWDCVLSHHNQAAWNKEAKLHPACIFKIKHYHVLILEKEIRKLKSCCFFFYVKIW